MANIRRLAQQKLHDKAYRAPQAIIGSMTPQERRRSEIIKEPAQADRAGQRYVGGRSNGLLKQFVQMRKMLKAMGERNG